MVYITIGRIDKNVLTFEKWASELWLLAKEAKTQTLC